MASMSAHTRVYTSFFSASDAVMVAVLACSSSAYFSTSSSVKPKSASSSDSADEFAKRVKSSAASANATRSSSLRCSRARHVSRYCRFSPDRPDSFAQYWSMLASSVLSSLLARSLTRSSLPW